MLPLWKIAVPSNVVLKWSHDDSKSTSCFNAWFPKYGHLQNNGRDFFHLLGPYERCKILLFLVRRSESKKWHVLHVNFSVTFRIRDTDSKLYVYLNDIVYELQKNLYCLKLYHEIWYKTLKKAGEGLDWKHHKSGKCVFDVQVQNVSLLTLVQRDDPINLSSTDIELDWLQHELRSLGKLTSLQKRCWYLSVSIWRKGSTICLGLAAKWRRLFQWLEMDMGNSAPTPITDNTGCLFECVVPSEVWQDESPLFSYGALVKNLLQMGTCIRLDIPFAVNILSWFFHVPYLFDGALQSIFWRSWSGLLYTEYWLRILG